jgi:hypothetical protein
MYFDIIKAEYLNDYKISLQFEDGSKGVADLSSYPNKNNVFRNFFDIEYFKNYQIEYGTLTWGDGDIDIAPETLYTLATGKPIRYISASRSELKKP